MGKPLLTPSTWSKEKRQNAFALGISVALFCASIAVAFWVLFFSFGEDVTVTNLSLAMAVAFSVLAVLLGGGAIAFWMWCRMNKAPDPMKGIKERLRAIQIELRQVNEKLDGKEKPKTTKSK